MPSEQDQNDDKPFTIDEYVDDVFFDHARWPWENWDELAELTFHGRDTSRAILVKALSEALHTQKNVLLVGGAGHGKTTLIRVCSNITGFC